MKKILLPLAVILLAAVLLCPFAGAGGYSGWTEKQETVHEIADMARELGLSEDNPIILECQKIWQQEEEDKTWSEPELFTITRYCNCRQCCGKYSGGPTASGVMPTVDRTVAVDRRVIPMGAEVEINGKIYIAEDTGVRGNHIDIYCASHSEALMYGTYKTTVRWRLK